MGRISPRLATVGGDEDIWGDETNQVLLTLVGQGNDQEDRVTVLESDGALAKVRLSAAEGNIQSLQTTVSNLTGTGGAAPVIGIDTDGTPYYFVPGSAVALLTEQGDRFLFESGDTWVVD